MRILSCAELPPLIRCIALCQMARVIGSIFIISAIMLLTVPVQASLSADGSSQAATSAEFGSSTQIINAGSGTVLSHSASSAQSLSRDAVYGVYSVSSSHGAAASSSSHMQVDESIVSGRSTFSVVSASSGSRMSSSAWKDPEIEIEEEYIGTFHITKNFTINESNVVRTNAGIWLILSAGGCGVNLTGYGGRVPPTADDVFDCRR